MASRPLQRTIAYYKAQGIRCETVERWIPRPGVPGGGFRKDLMNIIDCIALGPDKIIGVQCCAGSGNAAHIRKLMEDERENTLEWVSKPYTRLEIHAWRQLKKVRGKAAKYWSPIVTVIDMSDLKGGT